jgi:hypothetical protein
MHYTALPVGAGSFVFSIHTYTFVYVYVLNIIRPSASVAAGTIFCMYMGI